MSNKMLIDATHPEETRVVVLRGNRVEEFDFEAADRRQLRGNIYLAKVTRVEPSLQAAFVDYGGNRHGFLAFSEIHPDYYQIPFADRQALLQEQAREDAEQAERDEAQAQRDAEKAEQRGRPMRRKTKSPRRRAMTPIENPPADDDARRRRPKRWPRSRPEDGQRAGRARPRSKAADAPLDRDRRRRRPNRGRRG